MSCSCCETTGPRNILFLVIVVAVLGGGLAGIAKLFRQVAGTVSLPDAAWIPLATAAVLGTLVGLWLGFRQHGRAQPLAVGVFGLLVAGLGLLIGYPIMLLGVAIVLGATLWSAMAHLSGSS